MKKLLLIVCLMFAFMAPAMAANVNVGKADLYAYKFGGESYLVMALKDDDDDYRVVASPVIRMLLFDGTVLEFSGEEQSQETKTSTHKWAFGYSTGSVNNVHYAVFPVTPEQLESLKKGVKKIAINTIPNVYVKDYSSDKVGKDLLELFSKLNDDF